jgi:hypothetical protein
MFTWLTERIRRCVVDGIRAGLADVGLADDLGELPAAVQARLALPAPEQNGEAETPRRRVAK